VGERAASKLSSAGRRAFARGDAPAAANLFERATQLLPLGSEARIELLPELGESRIEQGTFEAASTALDEATSAAREAGFERLEARAELVRYHLKLNSTGSFGDTNAAVAAVEGYINVFESTGDILGLARAWHVLGSIHITIGRYDLAADELERLIDYAKKVGEGRLASRGAILYGYATLHGKTPVSNALANCEEYIELTRTDRSAEAIMLGVLAELHAMQGQFDEARALLERSHELISDIGSSVTAASTSLEASRVEMLAGEPATAETLLRRDYDALEAIGETYFRSTVAGLLGAALWELQRHDDAERFAGISRDIADDDDVLSQVLWRSVMGKALARRGDVTAAVDLATSAVELAAPTADIELHADALTALADVLGSVGRSDEEEPRLREALALYERKGDIVLAGALRDRLAAVTHR
jgi:tetratricopeptide (TPR) repeat protein